MNGTAPKPQASRREVAVGLEGALVGMTSETVRIAREGCLGRITLSRPGALNALTIEMTRRIDACLADWAADNQIAAVVVEGDGRAFCAGGDIRALHDAIRRGGDPLTATFYREEYHLNLRIFDYPKPYISLLDGIVMGGGAGISIPGSHRLVTEATVFAMPETAIGFFPDVGATYYLSRIPGRMGIYLGLTGTKLKAADTLFCGLGTHFVPRDRRTALVAALAEIDPVADVGDAVAKIIAAFAAEPGPPSLAGTKTVIDRCFGFDSVEAIMAALRDEAGVWARRAHSAMEAASPTSLTVTLRQISGGRRLSFAAAMRREFRLSQRFVAGHDFPEGIRAAIVDRDGKPEWNPARLDAITEADVEAYFAPLPGGELDTS